MRNASVQERIGNIFRDQLCALRIGMNAVAGILIQLLIGDAAVVNVDDRIAVGGQKVLVDQ